MAIYKNREVQVLGPNPQANSPLSINVSYVNGIHENVKLSEVRFTKLEKDALIKQFPSTYDNVEVITDQDLEAVRLGVPPSFDKTAYEAAQAQVQHQKQVEMNQKQVDEMKAKVEAESATSAPKVS